MKISDLIPLIQAENLTPAAEDKEVTSGYCCDLLSWVMAHGGEGMAWVTVQTNMNVIAVALLNEMSCVILPESIRPGADCLEKAKEEGMAVLVSPLSSYRICGILYENGVGDRK